MLSPTNETTHMLSPTNEKEKNTTIQIFAVKYEKVVKFSNFPKKKAFKILQHSKKVSLNNSSVPLFNLSDFTNNVSVISNVVVISSY